MSVTFTLDDISVTLRNYEKGDTDIFDNAMRFIITRAATVRTYRKDVKRKRSLSFTAVPRSDYNTILTIAQESYSTPITFVDSDGLSAQVYLRASLSATHSGKKGGFAPPLLNDPTGHPLVDFQLEVIYA